MANASVHDPEVKKKPINRYRNSVKASEGVACILRIIMANKVSVEHHEAVKLHPVCLRTVAGRD